MSDALDPQALLEGTTPGPWGISHSPSEATWTVYAPDAQLFVARIMGEHNAMADADLIRAAPDLASALIEASSERDAWARLTSSVQAERDAARTENERLREALKEAVDLIEEWAGYASDYFKEKWDLAGDLARVRAALSPKEPTDGKDA